MGIMHAAIANALSEGVVSICEKDRLLSTLASKVLPKVQFYDDPVEMVTKENLDAVYVTTPTHTHVPILEKLASQTGLGVFCEKPLAESCDKATYIARIFEGRTVMVGFQKRFSSPFLRGKELLDKQVLGDLSFFRSHCYLTDVFGRRRGWRYEKGTGGVLLDLGVHLADILLWYFGEPKVVKSVKRAIYSEGEDYVHSVLRFNTGLVGSMEVCWSVRNHRLPELHIEISGKKGTMVINDDYLHIERDKENLTTPEVARFHKQAMTPSVNFLLADPEYTLESRAFLESVSLEQKCRPDFNDAAKVNRLVDTIHREAKKDI